MQSAVAGLLIGTWSYATLLLVRIVGEVNTGIPLVLPLAILYIGVIPWAHARGKLPSSNKWTLIISVVPIVVVILGGPDSWIVYGIFAPLSAGHLWLLESARSSRSLASWVVHIVIANLTAVAIVLAGLVIVAFE